MNDLIQINQTQINGTEVNSVNARELHEALESKYQFTDWIKTRLEEVGAVENEEYIVFQKNLKNPQGGRPQKEYIINLELAKEFSMLERNEKGKQARRYFIECEKQLKTQALKHPEDFTMQSIIQMAQGFLSHGKQIKQIKSDVSELKNTSTLDYAQQQKIQKAVANKVVQLRQVHNLAKEMDKKLFQGIYHNLKEKFKVGSYKDIPKVKFMDALYAIDKASIKKALV